MLWPNYGLWEIEDRLYELALAHGFNMAPFPYKPTCYLSGMMTGLPYFNFPAFDKAAEMLATSGWKVYSPAENDREKGLQEDPEGLEIQSDNVTFKDLMKTDLWQVCDSDAVFVLPGWEYSKGALLEVIVAQKVGVPVYSLLSGWKILPGEASLEPHELSIGHTLNQEDPAEINPWSNRKIPVWEEVLANEERLGIRKFTTGATRNTDTSKPDFEGFLSPLALRAFGDYMHSHRVQADGTVRDSDNWQKGIPLDAYMKSLWRHVVDVWTIHRGFTAFDYDTCANVEILDALCGVLFNAQGMIHELKKEAA